jgi:PAS domain S-box-containing protein
MNRKSQSQKAQLRKAQSQKESILEASLDHINHGVVVYDQTLTVLRINRRAREILHVSPDQFSAGEPFENLARMNASRGGYGGLGEMEERIAKRMAKARSFAAFKEDQLLFNGNTVEVYGHPIPGGGYVITYTDITDRVKAEQSARDSEERFRDFAGVSSDWYWGMDKTLRFSYFSERFESVTGIDPSFLLGRTHDETSSSHFYPEARQKRLDDMAARRPFRNYEQLRKNSDGSILHFSINGVPVFDADGVFLGYRGTGRDITARKIAETGLRKARDDLERRVDDRTKELRDSEKRFRDFATATADWFWESDVSHKFTYFSEKYEQLTQNSPERIYGKTHIELSAPLNDKDRLDEHAAFLASHAPFRDLDLAYNTDEIGLRWMRISGTPIFDHKGAFTGYRGSGSEATALKRNEERLNESEQKLQQAQKMEVVGQLTGGVAHDFNNLLGVIVGNLDFYKEPGVDAAMRDELIETAIRAAERGAELTHRLLAFARKQTLSPVTTDINGLTANMKGFLRPILGEAISIELSLEPGLPAVEVDPAQLESSLVNLAVNARDAMAGDGALTLATARVHLDEAFAATTDGVSPGDYLEITVSDTGQGIASNILPQVFEPFYTTKPVGEGSGLGLSMVHGFIKQSNGHISIDSTEGVGTAIRMFFPLSQALPDARDAEPELAAPPAGLKEIILVVEDDDELRNLAVMIVTKLRYTVLVAQDGPAAIEILDNAETIDLLFTHVVLPNGVNGSQIAEHAKIRHPDAKVLFTSGYNKDIVSHNGQLDPGVNLIPKPYRRTTLAQKIHNILRSETEREASVP